MSDLLQKLQQNLNTARKAQDKTRTLLLGTILADATNRRIELRRDLTNDDVVDVLQKGIKRRRESAEMYAQGNRPELAEKERTEAVVLAEYLPAQASPDDVREAVRTAIAGGASNVGAVMGRVMPQFKGRADGSLINAIAREELSRQG